MLPFDPVSVLTDLLVDPMSVLTDVTFWSHVCLNRCYFSILCLSEQMLVFDPVAVLTNVSF